MEAQKQFAEKCKKKAETFLKSIDPDLKAEVMTENKGGMERVVIQFKHAKNPKIFWNQVPFMQGGDKWIEGAFEAGVKRAYDETKEAAEDN